MYLTAQGSPWNSVSDSIMTQNVHLVNAKDLRDRVLQLPIKDGCYTSQDPTIELIGSMAQDFLIAYHLGRLAGHRSE